VAIDGLLAQEELARDGLVGLAFSDKPQHLLLPHAQAVSVGRRPGLGTGGRGHAHRVYNRDIGSGAEMNEDLPGGVPLERCAVLVAERLTGLSDEETDARAQVRRLDALPHLLSVA